MAMWACSLQVFAVFCIVFSNIPWSWSQNDDHSQYIVSTVPPGINDARPFRMNKLNLMWEKAKKMLDESRLPRLFAEFVVQDRLEMEWKKRKLDGFDEDGEQEAITRHKFLGILDQFGLRAIYPDDPDYLSSSIDGKDRSSVLKQALKTDPKLSELWNKAERSGFSDGELNILKEEFGHLAEKLDEYQQLKREIDKLDGLSQNSIERFKSESDNLVSDNKIKDKHSALKNVFQDLKQGYSNLERMTEQLSAGSDQKQKEFSDPRVRELWVMALKANMTEEELSSFKTELTHFEHKIQKHEFFEKEAHMSRASLNMKRKDSEELPDSHIKLEQKVKHYALKVKKWYTELKSRLLKASPYADEL